MYTNYRKVELSDSSSTPSDIVTQAKDFFQDNSAYIFIGLGVAILVFTMRK